MTPQKLTPLVAVSSFIMLAGLAWTLVTFVVRAVPVAPRRDEETHNDDETRWRESIPWTPMHALAIYLLASFLSVGALLVPLIPVGMAILGGQLRHEHLAHWTTPLKRFVFNDTSTGAAWLSVLLILSVWFVRRQSPVGGPFGWLNRSTVREDVYAGFKALLKGLGLSFLAMVAYRVGVALGGALLPVDTGELQGMLHHLKTTERAADNSWGLAMLALLLAPFAEEVFYRGLLYRSLRKRWSMEVATAIVALLFAGIHERVYYFLPTFVMGMVACEVYERRKSLVAPIALHGFWNLLSVGRLALKALTGAE
ncbi:MAG: CPBP family intramembrane metalloprotease [Elusimicrobia bacterium]|nr:CPBP family intramembrane metalloprotease [Elusimicrobiota bacterium]